MKIKHDAVSGFVERQRDAYRIETGNDIENDNLTDDDANSEEMYWQKFFTNDVNKCRL